MGCVCAANVPVRGQLCGAGSLLSPLHMFPGLDEVTRFTQWYILLDSLLYFGQVLSVHNSLNFFFL